MSEDSSQNRSEEQMRKKKAKEPKGLTEEKLEENINMAFGETSTITLFFMPSATSTQDNSDFTEYQKKNKDYEHLLKIKSGSDNYGSRSIQTFNHEPKQKNVETAKVNTTEKETFAAEWDISDTRKEKQLDFYEQTQLEIKKTLNEEIDHSLKNGYSMLPTSLDSIKGWISETQNQVHEHRRDARGERIRDGESNKDTTTNNGMTGMTGNYTGNVTGNLRAQNTQTRTTNKLEASTTRSILKKDTTGLGHHTKSMTKRSAAFTDTTDAFGNITQPISEEPEEPQYTEEEQKLIENPHLPQSLKYVERILNQSSYHKQIVTYRNYPELKIQVDRAAAEEGNKRLGGLRVLRQAKIENENQPETKEELSTINFLFKFACEQSKDRTVSSMDWNPVNTDLLAASYGEADLSPDRDGYLMFWSLKNPNFPERIIKSSSKVMTCQFSKSSPNLIATGCYNGVVAIYDIRVPEDRPIADSKLLPGKHLDVVWETQWVPKNSSGGGDKGETLVSISSDGRVVEWSMKKGLEYQDLMNMKRQGNPANKEDNIEGINFRNTAGFSFDFLKGESSVYLASTEDGTVHRCSKSYNEQYLENYFGHKGPVYKVRANPYCPELFLTCSADWSCRLWNWRDDQSKYIFQKMDLRDEVLDIEWNPWMSTMFASSAKDGRLEIWDVAQNLLDPIACEMSKDDIFLPARKTVKFSPKHPILVSGDIKGDIKAYRIFGFDDQFTLSNKQQEDRLLKAVYPTGHNKREGHDM